MKYLLSPTLQHTAPLLPIGFWQGLWGGRLILPFYHLVSDEAPAHIRYLYPVRGVRQLREDLDFLLRHFQPVDIQTLWQHVVENRPFERPVFHLSFDDGLRECHELVAPILLEKGVPATFFLNTDFVDNCGLMFRYKASLLKSSGKTLPADPLRVRYADRQRLDTWAADLGLDFSAYLASQKPYLDTAQIQIMYRQGFSFGAHSLDHPQYGEIPLEEQIRQTVESLQRLKGMADPGLPLFAFPFTDDGVGLAFFQAISEQMGGPLLTFGTAGVKRDTVPTHLQRFPMERTTKSARTMVSAELATAVLRKVLGKQVVGRS